MLISKSLTKCQLVHLQVRELFKKGVDEAIICPKWKFNYYEN
jgi:hypothetical protein